MRNATASRPEPTSGKNEQQLMVDTARQAAAAAAAPPPTWQSNNWSNSSQAPVYTNKKVEQLFQYQQVDPYSGATASSPQNMGSNSSDTNCTVPDLSLATATSAGNMNCYAVVPQFTLMPQFNPAMGLPPMLGGALPPFTQLVPAVFHSKLFLEAQDFL